MRQAREASGGGAAAARLDKGRGGGGGLPLSSPPPAPAAPLLPQAGRPCWARSAGEEEALEDAEAAGLVGFAVALDADAYLAELEVSFLYTASCVCVLVCVVCFAWWRALLNRPPSPPPRQLNSGVAFAQAQLQEVEEEEVQAEAALRAVEAAAAHSEGLGARPQGAEVRLGGEGSGCSGGGGGGAQPVALLPPPLPRPPVTPPPPPDAAPVDPTALLVSKALATSASLRSVHSKRSMASVVASATAGREGLTVAATAGEREGKA